MIVCDAGEFEVEGDFSSGGGGDGLAHDEPFDTRTQSPLASRSQKRSGSAGRSISESSERAGDGCGLSGGSMTPFSGEGEEEERVKEGVDWAAEIDNMCGATLGRESDLLAVLTRTAMRAGGKSRTNLFQRRWWSLWSRSNSSRTWTDTRPPNTLPRGNVALAPGGAPSPTFRTSTNLASSLFATMRSTSRHWYHVDSNHQRVLWAKLHGQ